MTVIMVTHSVEEAALLSDEVLVTGIAPISVIKKFVPPKNSRDLSWQKIGLRKSLQNKDFQNYMYSNQYKKEWKSDELKEAISTYEKFYKTIEVKNGV